MCRTDAALLDFGNWDIEICTWSNLSGISKKAKSVDLPALRWSWLTQSWVRQWDHAHCSAAGQWGWEKRGPITRCMHSQLRRGPPGRTRLRRPVWAGLNRMPDQRSPHQSVRIYSGEACGLGWGGGPCGSITQKRARRRHVPYRAGTAPSLCEVEECRRVFSARWVRWCVSRPAVCLAALNAAVVPRKLVSQPRPWPSWPAKQMDVTPGAQ